MTSRSESGVRRVRPTISRELWWLERQCFEADFVEALRVVQHAVEIEYLLDTHKRRMQNEITNMFHPFVPLARKLLDGDWQIVGYIDRKVE